MNLEQAKQRWAGEVAAAAREGRTPDPRMHYAGEKFWADLFPNAGKVHWPSVFFAGYLALILACAALVRLYAP